jgi:hypothetical protein
MPKEQNREYITDREWILDQSKSCEPGTCDLVCPFCGNNCTHPIDPIPNALPDSLSFCCESDETHEFFVAAIFHKGITSLKCFKAFRNDLHEDGQDGPAEYTDEEIAKAMKGL